MKCNIYRCSRQEEMYLYVHADKSPEELPKDLLKLVKELTHVMELDLAETKKLARASITDVIESLKEKDYFLQMPPKDMQVNLHYGD